MAPQSYQYNKKISKTVPCIPYSPPGTELAPLMKQAVTGKPRKDPATGYMMNHNLHTTDVTRLATHGYHNSFSCQLLLLIKLKL